MKTTKSMMKIITKITEKHGVKLDRIGDHIRLEMDCYEPLVIEVVGPNQVSVAHYCYNDFGDAMADPDLVFYTGFGEDGWVPVEATLLMGYTRAGRVSPRGELTHINSHAVTDLVRLANMWARNIKHQGWLENGRPPSETEMVK